MQGKTIQKIHPEDNIDKASSLKEIILGIRYWIRYLLSKWMIILFFGALGAALGFFYSLIKRPVYTAITSFVLESGNNKGALGAYAGLASSIGIDLGNAGGGLFEGENILELYKSRNMISSSLLASAVFDNKKQLLIDRYIEFNKLREKWNKYPKLRQLNFRPDGVYSNAQSQLLHDSVMGRIVKDINENNLTVQKKDKKLNIIYVTVASTDEFFAKALNDELVKNVNEFYLATKTKRNLENVSILQAKTDSVRRSMTGAIYNAATVADATPNQNPTRLTQRLAPIQNSSATAEINKEVLGTLLQNLEMGKVSLLRETPLIQIVDNPIFPLEKKGVGKIQGVLLGGIFAGFLIIGILVVRRIIKQALAENEPGVEP